MLVIAATLAAMLPGVEVLQQHAPEVLPPRRKDKPERQYSASGTARKPPQNGAREVARRLRQMQRDAANRERKAALTAGK